MLFLRCATSPAEQLGLWCGRWVWEMARLINEALLLDVWTGSARNRGLMIGCLLNHEPFSHKI